MSQGPFVTPHIQTVCVHNEDIYLMLEYGGVENHIQEWHD